MTSVFSSLTWPARPRRDVALSDRSDTPTELATADEPDLRDLNNALQALCDIFPDIQPEVFREMLQNFSEESRLEVITETLLKNDAKYVRGRYRMPLEREEQQETAHQYKYRKGGKARDTRGAPLAREDRFRSRPYREAVKDAFYQEFKGLRHSTIKAVLAEYNFSYTNSRPTLLELVNKSWRFSIANIFMRRKPPSAENHPLIVWTSPDAKTGRFSMPLVIKTKSPELNEELYSTLVVPVLQKRKQEQMRRDQKLAHSLNEAEAEEAEEMYDCECCFITYTVQQMSTCDTSGHWICFRCIRFSVNAALYDQGWAKNINSERGTLQCIAFVAGGGEECTGCVSLSFVKRALLEEDGGGDTYQKLKERFAAEALRKCQLPLIRCPFCPYAEVDDFANPLPSIMWRRRARPPRTSSISLVSVGFLALQQLVLCVFLLPVLLILLINTSAARVPRWCKTVAAATRRLQLKRRGLRFICQSPTCGRASCIACSAPWHDPHTCYSSQRESLRLALERATTDAVKRTCPRCSLSFVKSEGCNKLVCPCGYTMCYICRADLSQEGYSHFCQHFRERPGQSCTVCEKCDLYRVEDDEIVIKQARERAEREWWAKQGVNAEGMRELSSMDRMAASREVWLEWMLDMMLM